MPLTARVSAKAPTGALAQASATAPKTPREARRITSNADIGTPGCVPGARRAESPRRLFTSSAPLRKTPTGGLLFPAGEEILSADLELKAIVEPDLTFRATMTSQTTGRRGGLGGLFCLGALQRDGGFRAALLLSGGINDGVAESHRCVAATRGPPPSPRAAPNARGFFCIRPRAAALFVSKRGNKGAPCRVNSPRAPSTGPATRRGMTRWHGRRPKCVRSAWAWK